MTLFLVSLFGALGCVIRYVMEYAVRTRHSRNRPWATVAANGLGCLVAGYGAYRLVGVTDAHLRTVVLTGFCGGLTTFSSAFAIPAILQREHHWGYSAVIVLTTPLLCAGLFVIGMSLAH
jgi:CrcB protein